VKLHSTRDAADRREADFGRRRYAYLRRLMPAPAPGARALDCGAGAGELATIARELGFEPVCVEIAPGNLRTLREAGLPTVCADLNAPLPVAAESFDLVILSDVLEHLPRAEVLLAEVARVLRPGGKCLLSTPNVAYWEYRLRALLGYPPPVEGRHFRFFTRKHLLRRAKAAGLRLVGRASHGPVKLLNLVLKPLGGRELWCRVPAVLETVLGHTFVLLLEKVGSRASGEGE
jgi:SAM-dependent methyltransferase